MKARVIETNAAEPTYLKIALYKPNETNSGNANPVETKKATHWSLSKTLHLSNRKPNANQILIKQTNKSQEITILLLTERGRFNKDVLVTLIGTF